ARARPAARPPAAPGRPRRSRGAGWRRPPPRAGRRTPPWRHAAAGRSASTFRRPPSRRWPPRAARAPPAPAGAGRRPPGSPSEVPLAFAVLHRGLGGAVVGPGGAALGEPGDRHLGDDVVDRGRVRADRAGAGGVADGAVPHGLPAHSLPRKG